MNTLPVVLFTKNRTACACATVESLLANFSATGWSLRHVVCDDQSVPGHLEAVLRVYRAHGIEPSVHVTTPQRFGLGASMNMGLEDAFSDSDRCFRLEDDWLLTRPLDIGPLVDRMDGLDIGLLRLGMLFRMPSELVRVPECRELLIVKSKQYQAFTFNNQLGVVMRKVHELAGMYRENCKPSMSERSMGNVYNRVTRYGTRPPYVAWPTGWATFRHYDPTLPFAHIGVSIAGHKKLYKIPEKYLKYNDPALDSRLRAEALS